MFCFILKELGYGDSSVSRFLFVTKIVKRHRFLHGRLKAAVCGHTKKLSHTIVGCILDRIALSYGLDTASYIVPQVTYFIYIVVISEHMAGAVQAGRSASGADDFLENSNYGPDCVPTIFVRAPSSSVQCPFYSFFFLGL